jgi:hypothetical protein
MNTESITRRRDTGAKPRESVLPAVNRIKHFARFSIKRKAEPILFLRIGKHPVKTHPDPK